MRQRLQTYYYDHVVPQMRQKFGYKNIHQIPHLEKIVINRGLGRNAQNVKVLESLLFELTIIAAQQGVLTRARKAIAHSNCQKKKKLIKLSTLQQKKF